jgi:alpha-tubulin suppressor-like RCC1 family protein
MSRAVLEGKMLRLVPRPTCAFRHGPFWPRYSDCLDVRQTGTQFRSVVLAASALFGAAAGLSGVACSRTGISQPWDENAAAAEGGAGAAAGAPAANAGRGGTSSGTAGDKGGSAPTGRGGAGGASGCSGTGCEPEPPAYPVQITAGQLFTCALGSNGVIKCWGHNAYGSLGIEDDGHRGNQPNEMGSRLPAVKLGTNQRATEVSAGGEHGCALLREGTVKCWGRNFVGELGLGDVMHRGWYPGELGDALPFVELSSSARPVALSAGDHHGCALLDDASVKCWGDNYSGRLGLGDEERRGDQPGELGDALPRVDVGSGRSVLEIQAGYSHTCALLDDASVKCWGGNDYGQLGQSDTRWRGNTPGQMGDALAPVALGEGRSAEALALGGAHACALLDDASVKCWGGNSYGQLGLGDDEHRGDQPGELGDALPSVDLGADARAIAIAAGGFHSCALLDDGSVRCWGYGLYGQLGQGDTRARGDQPGELGPNLPAIELGSGRRALSLACGSLHACALLDDRSLKCWGWNQAGTLGLADDQPRGDEPGEMGDALPSVELSF